MKKIGIGIIGASSPGWAAISHVPALKALPDYELRAISTSRRESAERAAAEFGVPAAFDDHRDLIAHPDVDLVVVAVKVTHHHALVSAALEAGKMVYSEWPLGVNLSEAADLAERARAAGVRTVIGLQARFSPVVRYARDLVADGYVGRVLGTAMIGSGLSWGPETDRAHAYIFDAANGATLLTAAGLHALEALNFALGDFARVSANLVNGRKEVQVVDEGTTIPVTTADQLSVTGTLDGGAAVSFFYRGGFSRGNNLRWEINGTEGDLVLTAPGVNGNLQVADMRLEGGRGGDTAVAELVVPDRYFDPIPRALPALTQNVAQTYAALAKDLRNGTDTVPGFDYALARHRLVDAIERASRTGSVQGLIREWPTEPISEPG
ncbi:Gfo/Idh/MocA family oxidoreductase [Microbispora sp. RL4-1S]|uniref:Gfo/Idh/MocA family oxidoreductase n=1 Tax=Microbispora oryzae TaxID=2806554 RepID=A0A940WIX9_9ACTN|nr:Gfo/Idh/MocA family oxidoreductase [Microbispora oryzae]MBP2706366.1 Gfo/Idh/MocA family oxidoreductase [Microbispora oryzae]